MNELETALLIRRALDKSTERLPYKTVHRLESARKLALSRMNPVASEMATTRTTVTNGPSSLSLSSRPSSLGWLAGLASAVAPIILVVVGMIGASNWSDQKRADEVAEVDAAMLADDLPIALYADRGFGVFIKNNNQQ